LKIDEKRLPQDGRFTFKVGEQEIDLRVSSLPTTHGEKIVMRLLKKTGGVPELPELGLRGMALQNLQNAILRPHGIIIIYLWADRLWEDNDALFSFVEDKYHPGEYNYFRGSS
ncbi:hypothetical protein GTO36_07710, partial [bacterium]|nr:hypothetical protein [bacterium]